MIKRIVLFLLIAGLSACSVINPSIMFKTPAGYKFTEPKNTDQADYKIAPFDIIEFRIYTNDGYKLIDLVNTSTGAGSSSSNLLVATEYIVDREGNIKIPVIGNVKVTGYTKLEAEKFLEEKFAAYYNKPFIKLRVVNRRVFVFNGTGGSGQVVPLLNDKTTLIEALARAGGITATGKAKRIKVIRGDLKNPEIQLVDLSTIEGLKKADLLVEANDIIYVEPVKRLSQEILTQITPILSLLSSFLLIYGLVIKK